MTTVVHHRRGDGAPLTDRHRALMVVAVLVTLVLAGGLTGLAIGRLLVLGVHLLLGAVGTGG